MYCNVTKDYIHEFCNDNGTQTNDNLTKAERRGIKKLNARAKDGQIVINQSDKSDLISISTRDNYLEQGAQHIGKRDQKLNWKQVNQLRETISKHSKALANIFKVGENHGKNEETRIRTTMNEKVTTIPKVSAQPKDHKQIPASGVPKTRGVTGASRSLNQRISDMTNDNLTYMLKSDQSKEIGSTEKLLNVVEQVNLDIDAGKIDSTDMIIGSLDVNALYASINMKQAVQLTREAALNSNCRWEGIDYRWALIYLALTLKPWERVKYKMVDVIPRRLSKKNNPPTIATVETDEVKERWYYPTPLNLLSQSQKKVIMGKDVPQVSGQGAQSAG